MWKKNLLKSIIISDKHFKPSNGPLKIENFTALTNLDVNDFMLIELSIIDCPQLSKIDLLKINIGNIDYLLLAHLLLNCFKEGRELQQISSFKNQVAKGYFELALSNSFLRFEKY